MLLPLSSITKTRDTVSALLLLCRVDTGKEMFWPSEIFHLAGWLFLKTIDNPLSGNWETGRASSKPRRDTREALIQPFLQPVFPSSFPHLAFVWSVSKPMSSRRSAYCDTEDTCDRRDGNVRVSHPHVCGGSADRPGRWTSGEAPLPVVGRRSHVTEAPQMNNNLTTA